jgi:hypothetical protein
MFLFDVADSIRIESPAPKPGASHGTRYLGFDPPPRLAGSTDVRIALFEFGVVGVTFSIPFSGGWAELNRAVNDLLDDTEIPKKAREHARRALEEFQVDLQYDHWLAEEYLIVELPQGIDKVANRAEIAGIVRGESQPLAEAEISEVMGSALSCYPYDTLVVGWAAAFVSDTPEGAQSTLQLLEFANAQLLELRHYDNRVQDLIKRLNRIQQQRKAWWRRWGDVRETQRLNQVRLEVMNLMERSDNSLRVLGDMFYARAYRTVSLRIGVDDYRKLLEEKLEVAGAAYHFLVEEFNHARAFTLEAMVVVILIIELGMTLFKLR